MNITLDIAIPARVSPIVRVALVTVVVILGIAATANAVELKKYYFYMNNFVQTTLSDFNDSCYGDSTELVPHLWRDTLWGAGDHLGIQFRTCGGRWIPESILRVDNQSPGCGMHDNTRTESTLSPDGIYRLTYTRSILEKDGLYSGDICPHIFTSTSADWMSLVINLNDGHVELNQSGEGSGTRPGGPPPWPPGNICSWNNQWWVKGSADVADFLYFVSSETVDVCPAAGLTLHDPHPFLANQQSWIDTSSFFLQSNMPTGLAVDGNSIGVLRFESLSSSEVTFSIEGGGGTKLHAYTPNFPLSLPPAVPSVPVATEEYNGFFIALALISSPETWPQEGLGQGSVVTVKALQDDIETTFKISLRPPPVLTVHGLWSEGSAWDGLHSFLAGRYGSPVIQPVDYEDLNSYSFGGIATHGRMASAALNALEQTRSQGVISTQVDVVGHSMGGLLTRNLAENYATFRNRTNYNNGWVNRLVTVGTPHLGSPMADWLITHKDLAPVPNYTLTPIVLLLRKMYGTIINLEGVTDFIDMNISNGAVEALRPGSPELGSLSSRGVLPFYAIEGVAPNYSGAELVFDQILFRLFDPSTSLDVLLDPIPPHGRHDTIVPGESQTDGYSPPYKPIFGVVHASATPGIDIDTTETTSTEVFRAVLCELSWELMECGPAAATASTSVVTADETTSVPMDEIDMAAMTEVPATNIIVTPASGANIPFDQKTTVSVVSSGAKTLSRVLVFYNGSFGELTATPFEFEVKPEGLTDTNVHLLALFDDDTYAYAPIVYHVDDPGVLLTIDTDARVTMVTGGSYRLSPAAYHEHGPLDIRNLATYQIVSGVGVVEVDGSGVVSAIVPGQAVVRIEYGGFSADVDLEVVEIPVDLGVIFEDAFELGDTSNWSAVSP